MTTTWHYDVGLVLDDNGQPLAGAQGQYRLPAANGPGAVAPVTDTAGSPLTIKSSSYGAFSRFNVTDDNGAWGYLDFNGIILPVVSIEVLNALPAAQAAQAAAVSAQTAAQQAVTDAQAAIAAAQAGGGALTDGSVTNAKVAVGISADKLVDGTANKAYLAAEKTKLAGVANAATANSPDTQLRDRSTHTGTQSADSVVDGTTNKAYTAIEKTKLAAVPVVLVPAVTRTLAQGVPTAAQCAAAGYPDGTVIYVDKT